MDDCSFLSTQYAWGRGHYLAATLILYFERLLCLNIQEWLLQHAIEEDMIPWLTSHNMKLNFQL